MRTGMEMELINGTLHISEVGNSNRSNGIYRTLEVGEIFTFIKTAGRAPLVFYALLSDGTRFRAKWDNVRRIAIVNN